MWKKKLTGALGSKTLKAMTDEVNGMIKGWTRLNEVFLSSVFNKFKELADTNLDRYTTPYSDSIKESWACEIDAKTGRMKVTCNDPMGKSAAIEFGVGLVGGGSPHANAAQAGYRYNVDSGRKDSTGTWIFNARKNTLDLWDASSYFLLDKGKGRFAVFTRGEPATMFAYNALMDLPQHFPLLMEQAMYGVFGD